MINTYAGRRHNPCRMCTYRKRGEGWQAANIMDIWNFAGLPKSGQPTRVTAHVRYSGCLEPISTIIKSRECRIRDWRRTAPTKK
jgi:hypothetical protein